MYVQEAWAGILNCLWRVSCGMKYAFEAMRIITCVKALYTEKTAHRIIHGHFANVRGGKGNNYANDLRMEMTVKAEKTILKGMCDNKTLKAHVKTMKKVDFALTLLSLYLDNMAGAKSNVDDSNEDEPTLAVLRDMLADPQLAVKNISKENRVNKLSVLGDS
ncbi:hypothetical protein ACROYT_G013844 [Oculina patagonica]